MGSLCSTSRAVQVREAGRGSPGRSGQKIDIKMNPTPPKRLTTDESNFTYKHAYNGRDQPHSLTLANPHAQERMNTEVKNVEERHNEAELQEEKTSKDPEPSAKTSEQPESPQNEKIDTPNEPTDTNESETTKIANEAPIDELVDKVDEPASIPPSSPQSTTVEINTPRRDLNPTQDIENEEIVIERPPGNKPSPDGITQDMVPKSLGIVVSPKYVVEKETTSTPASTEENTVSPAKETNAESELKNEADAIPGNIKEAASPQVDADDTLPLQESAEPTHTASEETSGIKDLNCTESSQASPHELTNVSPEDTTTSQETKEVIEDSVESSQPRDDTGNISVSVKTDLPLEETKMDGTTDIQEGEEKNNENPTDSN